MIENIIKNINEWKHLGFNQDINGSQIIGHTPRDFPQSYLHSYFAPLDNKTWNEYSIKLPNHLLLFYKECNGLCLFANSLSFYGIRNHYNRDLSSQFQPFDLITHNDEHKNIWHPLPKSIIDNRVFFGSYNWDGSGVYTTFDDLSVYRCIRNDSKSINKWDNIQYFIEQEYKRLEKLYDSKGYLIDENIPTTPE